MKFQIRFSGKNKKKYFKMVSAENFSQGAVFIKRRIDDHVIYERLTYQRFSAKGVFSPYA